MKASEYKSKLDGTSPDDDMVPESGFHGGYVNKREKLRRCDERLALLEAVANAARKTMAKLRRYQQSESGKDADAAVRAENQLTTALAALDAFEKEDLRRV